MSLTTNYLGLALKNPIVASSSPLSHTIDGIRQLEDATKTWLKYLNFLLPVFLAVGYGLYRMQRNKIKQYKRMSENYNE